MLTRRQFLKVSGTGLAGGALLAATGCMSSGGNDQGGSESGNSQTSNGNQEATVIKAGTVLAPSEPINVYAEKVSESIKKRTNGQVEIQVFPNSSLGSNLDMLEQSLAGAPITSYLDAGYLSDYVPDFGILNGPYLLEEPTDYKKLVNSEWFNGLEARLEEKGIKLLAFNWYFGSRHMISGKEIRTPADMQGFQVRVPPNVMWRETIKAMGGNPTELEWSEVYTGLNTGVVDAAEAPLSTLYSSKLYESAKILSMTEHFKAFGGWSIGAEYFETLPTDTQQIILEEFQKFGEEASQEVLRQEDEYKNKLQEEGTKFVEDVDIQAFKEATRSVYNAFPEWSPGLYEKVQGVLEKGSQAS